eukprot:scaffold10116_cov127-Cylindrotheca_fusiformis.AAC.2
MQSAEQLLRASAQSSMASFNVVCISNQCQMSSRETRFSKHGQTTTRTKFGETSQAQTIHSSQECWRGCGAGHAAVTRVYFRTKWTTGGSPFGGQYASKQVQQISTCDASAFCSFSFIGSLGYTVPLVGTCIRFGD